MTNGHYKLYSSLKCSLKREMQTAQGRRPIDDEDVTLKRCAKEHLAL